jgi:lambda family phage minor tail protein L
MNLNIDSPIITLMTIDATMIENNGVNAGVWHFTPNKHPTQGVMLFGGQAYLPLAFDIKGAEVNSSGAQPQPTLVLANNTGILREMIAQFEDLVGARVQFKRTFAKHLDDGEEPDTLAVMHELDLEIAQKSSETPEAISWKLRTFIDRMNINLPRRQIIREGGNPMFTLTAPAISRYRR